MTKLSAPKPLTSASSSSSASSSPKLPKSPRTPRTHRKSRPSPTVGQNGDFSPALNPFTPQHYASSVSRALIATAISRDRAPLRSVEVPGLGPNGGPAVAFYRPYSTGDFLRLIEVAERAQGASQIEQIRIIVDNLDGRWCDPDGRRYTRDEILAIEPANLVLVSNAILYAKELAVEDHESLLAELGVPLDANEAAALSTASTSLSPNASGGARSSARSIGSR